MRNSLVKGRLLVGVAAIGLSFTPGVAVAQTDQPTAEADAETIIVTGSRIARPELEAASPVQVLDQQYIAASGATNIQDLLLENPTFGVPGLSRGNTAFLVTGTGSATVDLRDLTADRTLVLINGRRVVSGVPGSAAVDLNVIPTQFVQRVDILTGGASSLYGSDAVAGVVNFIYKEDFEGLEVEGQTGITQRGDDEQYRLSLTGGGKFAGDRGSVIFHLGYSKQEGVLSKNRKNTALDDVDTWALTGDPEGYGVPFEPFLSSFPLQGRFDVAGTAGSGDDFTFDPTTGQLRRCFSTNGGAAPAACGLPAGTQIGPDGFNRQAFRTILVPVERAIFATRGRYELAEGVDMIAEATYVKTSASREIEPFALESNNIYPNTGRIPIETFVSGVPVLNPLVPAAIAAAAADRDGDGLRDIAFARRLGEVGSRTNDTTRDYFRVVTGFEGTFAERFRWDVAYIFGQTSESQTSNGQVNVTNFRNALAAVVDVNDANNNGSRTDAICADATARSQGCVPINIFGRGNITPQALDYINAEGTFQSTIKQHVLSANLSGDVAELPAGPLGFAIGAEYRKESSNADYDALTNAGLNGGNAIQDTAGSFDVKELYAEVRVPLLADTPFFHELSVGASGRISDYSTVGNVTTYSLSAEWAPVRDVRFRGTYSRAIRAPNVGELFAPGAQTFPAGLTDPCTGVGPTGGGTLGAVCRAAPGVAANIAANGVFTLTQGDFQGISGFNSGNPNLNEEKSDSYTAGVVINPRSIEALRNFALTVDYFNIKVKDAIQPPPRAFTLSKCYNDNDPFFCSLITRRPSATGSYSAGSIEYVNAPAINSGLYATEGIDVVLSYRSRLDLFGADTGVNARVAYTHYFEGYVVPTPGSPRDPYVGEIGNPNDKVIANLGFDFGGLSLSFAGTFIDRSYEDDQQLAAYGLPARALGVPSEFYLDAQARYKFGERAELFFGVDNLLDNDAPAILSGTSFNITGADTASDVYDPLGRRFYVGATFRF